MIGFIVRKLLFKVFHPAFLQQMLDEYEIKKHLSLCTIGQQSRLYNTSNIENRQKQPSKIKIGQNSHVRGELMIMGYGGEITIGNNVFVGEGTRIWSGDNVIINDNVLISHQVNIIDTNSHEIDHLKRADDFIKLTTVGITNQKGTIQTAPIFIDSYAWINFNTVIQKGVRIGEGAIVAPGSVVLTDVEPYTLVAGNPARYIKHLI